MLVGAIGRSTKAIVGLFLVQLTGILFLLPLFPLYGAEPKNLLAIAGLGLLPVASWLLYMKAAKIGDIAVAGPILRANFVVASILGIIFLGEQVSVFKIGGIIVVFAGAMLLSFKKESDNQVSGTKMPSGAMLAILSAIAVGILLFLLAPISRANGWYMTTLMLRAAVTGLVFLGLIGTRNTKEVASSHLPWLFIGAAALADVIGLSVYNMAVTRYEVSYVSVVASATPLVTVFLARLYLNERLQMRQYAGVLLMILGIIGLQVQWG